MLLLLTRYLLLLLLLLLQVWLDSLVENTGSASPLEAMGLLYGRRRRL